MILSSKDIKPKALQRYWASEGDDTKGLPPSQIDAIYEVLVHLHTAHSLSDIAEGIGKKRRHHKLHGHKPTRYAMDITGNVRIVYTCDDNGNVTVVDYGDYH